MSKTRCDFLWQTGLAHQLEKFAWTFLIGEDITINSYAYARAVGLLARILEILSSQVWFHNGIPR